MADLTRVAEFRAAPYASHRRMATARQAIGELTLAELAEVVVATLTAKHGPGGMKRAVAQINERANG